MVPPSWSSAGSPIPPTPEGGPWGGSSDLPLRRWLEGLLDFLFPPRCAVCGRLDAWLCDGCAARFAPLPAPFCPRCGRPQDRPGLCGRCRREPPPFQTARAPFLLEEGIRRAIVACKYRRRRRVGVALGELLAAAWPRLGLPRPLAIVPVPLHPRRQAWRGFNQATELARPLAAALAVPLLDGPLVRVRYDARQAALSAAERWRNVAGAFRWTAPAPPPTHVLVVDDVYTTGATLAAVATALKEAGARRVDALALAHER